MLSWFHFWLEQFSRYEEHYYGICNSEVYCCVLPGSAWFFHKSGGSNAHLLPEVLVNTDTHLDMFDSESEDASDFEELIIEVQAKKMVDPQWLELLIECVATDFVLVLLPFLWCFLFR